MLHQLNYPIYYYNTFEMPFRPINKKRQIQIKKVNFLLPKQKKIEIK